MHHNGLGKSESLLLLEGFCGMVVSPYEKQVIAPITMKQMKIRDSCWQQTMGLKEVSEKCKSLKAVGVIELSMKTEIDEFWFC